LQNRAGAFSKNLAPLSYGDQFINEIARRSSGSNQMIAAFGLAQVGFATAYASTYAAPAVLEAISAYRAAQLAAVNADAQFVYSNPAPVVVGLTYLAGAKPRARVTSVRVSPEALGALSDDELVSVLAAANKEVPLVRERLQIAIWLEQQRREGEIIRNFKARQEDSHVK
jgi:hypothetical protein